MNINNMANRENRKVNPVQIIKMKIYNLSRDYRKDII